MKASQLIDLLLTVPQDTPIKYSDVDYGDVSIDPRSVSLDENGEVVLMGRL